jgi:hypothetical protein
LSDVAGMNFQKTLDIPLNLNKDERGFDFGVGFGVKHLFGA